MQLPLSHVLLRFGLFLVTLVGLVVGTTDGNSTQQVHGEPLGNGNEVTLPNVLPQWHWGQVVTRGSASITTQGEGSAPVTFAVDVTTRYSYYPQTDELPSAADVESGAIAFVYATETLKALWVFIPAPQWHEGTVTARGPNDITVRLTGGATAIFTAGAGVPCTYAGESAYRPTISEILPDMNIQIKATATLKRTLQIITPAPDWRSGQITAKGVNNFTIRQPDSTTVNLTVDPTTAFTYYPYNPETLTFPDLWIGMEIHVQATGTGRLLRVSAAAVAPAAPVAPDRRLTLTHYFYWYDSLLGSHLHDSELRYHLPAVPAPNWRSTEWHKRQLTDMAYAGIDVVLPVYWGSPTTAKWYDTWSWQGLDVLAQAWQELKVAGQSRPQIGMMLDTTIVEQRDLTTASGKAFLYSNVKDFFSRIPREQWALVNGRPVIFLFLTDFVGAMNQSTFDHIYSQFQADFGVRPFIVREASWDYPILRWQAGKRIRDYEHPIQTDNSYQWGAAEIGFNPYHPGSVGSVGPGFDLRYQNPANRYTDRRDGAFYLENFTAAIASGKPMLIIETWNEMHEGSGVAETVEFGRQYLDLTRQFTAQFKARP